MQLTVLFDGSLRNIILIILFVSLLDNNFLLKPGYKLIIKETTTATTAAKELMSRTMAAHVSYNSWYTDPMQKWLPLYYSFVRM